MKTFIFITTTFSAVHCWPDCPFDEVVFLQSPHRHLFHVRMEKEVFHDNRDVEFIMFKNKVEDWIKTNYCYKNLGHKSCEMMARQLMEVFDCDLVEVSEDGENGAIIKKE